MEKEGREILRPRGKRKGSWERKDKVRRIAEVKEGGLEIRTVREEEEAWCWVEMPQDSRK